MGWAHCAILRNASLRQGRVMKLLGHPSRTIIADQSTCVQAGAACIPFSGKMFKRRPAMHAIVIMMHSVYLFRIWMLIDLVTTYALKSFMGTVFATKSLLIGSNYLVARKSDFKIT